MQDDRETDDFVLQLLKLSEPMSPPSSHDFQVRKNVPRPTSSLPSKEIKKATVVPQKKGDVPFEQKHCIPNQKYPLIHLEALKRRHFSTKRAKEQWIATRNLRHLSHEMQKWIYAQLRHDIKKLGQDNGGVYQLIERREERHFQIDRIIKYLSHF